MSSLIYRHFSMLSAILLLSACATGYAPVTDISSYSTANPVAAKNARIKIKPVPAKYKVRSGDTLYSIAWKYGLDFKRLAKINNINSRYLIHVGQVLQTKSAKSAEIHLAKKEKSINKTASVSLKTNKNSKNNLSTVRNLPQKKQQKTAVIQTNSNQSSNQNYTTTTSSKLIWKLPAKGQVIRKFNRENKGLDFSGRQGDAVYAAASGKVVYAGNGIIGYGNLIIIKHSPEYLSAYAHNSVILITENMQVKAGGKIAEIGSTGTTKTMLHFEIRKDGKPIDPLKYLPKK